MGADKGFLARWSRRKRGAATGRRERPTSDTAGDAPAPEAPVVPGLPPEPGSVVGPASLPPIDSIDAGADIRAFLAPGVPAQLARAALRRMWLADPAIRHFIGLSENSWDFTAPGGVPGFGSVTSEEVQRLLAQLAGEPEAAQPASERLPSDQAGASAREMVPAPDGSALKGVEDEQTAGIDRSAPQHDGPKDIAAQHEFAMREYSPLLQRRRHGGALPE